MARRSSERAVEAHTGKQSQSLRPFEAKRIPLYDVSRYRHVLDAVIRHFMANMALTEKSCKQVVALKLSGKLSHETGSTNCSEVIKHSKGDGAVAS